MTCNVYPADACRKSGKTAGWETHLTRAIADARGQPFVWGRHDCATWAVDLRRALTGGPDHAAAWRGRYRTPRGAVRVMRSLGWSSLEDGARALFGAPLEGVLLAQRGDLTLGGEPEALGVCLGAEVAFVGPAGLVFVPLASCRMAWRS